MAKKAIAVIILTVVFFFSLIFTIPIAILSDNFSNYARVDEDRSFYYAPSNSSTTEELNLKIDRSEVEIKYVYPPYDFVVKIDVYFEINGANALGKSYLDYFNIVWENSSSPLNFSMVYKSGVDQLEVLSLFSNITVLVSLRADVTFDIRVDIDEGEFDLLTPFMVPINNVDVDLGRGNIAFHFMDCVIGGNITGNVKVGNIDFILHNVEYIRNCAWNLTIDNGDLLFDIYQYKDIGANITGSGEINIGELRVVYKDYNPDVGALFVFHNLFGSAGIVEGFKEGVNEIDEDKWWLSRFFFYSYGFPGLNYYNISLFKLNRNPDAVYVYNLLNTNNTI